MSRLERLDEVGGAAGVAAAGEGLQVVEEDGGEAFAAAVALGHGEPHRYVLVAADFLDYGARFIAANRVELVERQEVGVRLAKWHGVGLWLPGYG
jgi:hypothetical protein